MNLRIVYIWLKEKNWKKKYETEWLAEVLNEEEKELLGKSQKDIFGVEYHFRNKEECAGLCTKDESDWLIKVLKAGD